MADTVSEADVLQGRYMEDPYIGKEPYPFDFENYEMRKREGKAVEDIQSRYPPSIQERIWSFLPPPVQGAAAIGGELYRRNNMISPMALLNMAQQLFPVLAPLEHKRYFNWQGSGGKRAPLIGE